MSRPTAGADDLGNAPAAARGNGLGNGTGNAAHNDPGSPTGPGARPGPGPGNDTANGTGNAVGLGIPQMPAPDYPAEIRARLDADAEQILTRYPDSRSALVPLLHLVQAQEGYVSRTGMRWCAERLGLTTAEVIAVASFYSMYRRKPGGDYHVGVCTNTLCAVLGGDAIFETLQEHLGVGNGETTGDGKVTLEHIECNAACDFAPVVMVNWEFFDNQTPRSATALVDDLRADREVRPTRGAPLCTFRETERILAGFPDERPGTLEATGSAGPASLAGLQLAKGDTGPGHVISPRTSAATGDEPAAGEPPPGYPMDSPPTTHPSSHDAPQESSASDPHHPAGPVTEEGE